MKVTKKHQRINVEWAPEDNTRVRRGRNRQVMKREAIPEPLLSKGLSVPGIS